MDASDANNWRNNNTLPQFNSIFHNPPSQSFYLEASPLPAHQIPAVNSPGQFQAPGPHYNHRPPWNHPRPQIGPSSAFNYSPNFSNRGIRQGGIPHVNYGPGKGQRYNHNSPNSGKGQMYNHNSPNSRHPYPNTGRSMGGSQDNYRGTCSRRGVGSGKHFSANEKPDLYYRKEMTEDPWKRLSPVIRERVEVEEKSWLPASIRFEKPKVVSSGEAFHGHIPQKSLARLLASSFDPDSVNEDADNESGT